VSQLAAMRTLPTPSLRWLRSAITLAALGLGLLLCSEDADARFSNVLGFGSASATGLNTVVDANDFFIPHAADPAHTGGSLGGLFNRPGLIGGFAAGFLGAGVLGLLFGHGVVGELSGAASVLGLLFQLSLLALLARLIWTWWHLDKTATFAELSPRQLADAYGRSRHEVLPDVTAVAGAEEDREQDAPSGEAFKQKGRAAG
jgi:hypothetical protein